MTTEIHCKSWEECEGRLLDLYDRHYGSKPQLCFRGHADSRWRLETTLERKALGGVRIVDFLYLIRRVRPELESFTGSRWPLPESQKFQTHSLDMKGIETLLQEQFYPYLAHLRHHGFPSPLLDWSLSPQVAAYFAFSRASEVASKNVAIFAFLEYPGSWKSSSSGEATIVSFGPSVQTHARHFRQKSQYTLCYMRGADNWLFAPHEQVLSRARTDQDLFWKFTVPTAERVRVLRRLDAQNVNAFSLFGSEDALLETLAVREFDL